MTRPGARGRVLRTILAVVGVAAVQAILVAGTASPSIPPALVDAGAVASFLVCVAGLAVVLDDAGRVAVVRIRRATLFSLTATALITVVAIFSVVAGAVAIVVALAFVPVVASGLRETVQTWRRTPVRSILRVLVTAVAIAVAAIVAMLLGLFITGWPASALAWLWFGSTTVLLVHWWSGSTREHRRALPGRRSQ